MYVCVCACVFVLCVLVHTHMHHMCTGAGGGQQKAMDQSPGVRATGGCKLPDTALKQDVLQEFQVL